MTNNKKLNGQIALVTGASRGLGKEIALSLAKEGATIIINYRTSSTEAEEIAHQILANGGRAIGIRADVSSEKDVINLFNEIRQQVGNVDILVNNAGINPIISLQDISLRDFQQNLDVNLTSAFMTIQQAIPAMQKNNFGRIINISSIAAQTGGIIGPHYAASKAGLIGLTRSYSKMLASSGITVNAIAPALIETDMVKNNSNIKPDLIPVGRYGQPDEVASVVLLLATNSYISGQTFNVNGGWYMS